jgi:NAD(P)-dependent dehydrogenase (short-subunit alcohol dehydrogenase family)
MSAKEHYVSNFDDYQHKRVIVTGCSSGIGEATARVLVKLGAEVIGIDRKPPQPAMTAFEQLDLGHPDSISAAATRIGGRVDALFNCAGVPPMVPPIEVLKVNFLGTRLLTQQVVNLMPPGSAIVNTSSDNGNAWRKRLPLLLDFLAKDTFDGGLAWYEEHQDEAGHPYVLGKEALNVWTMHQSQHLIHQGIRINAVSPGAVQTPMLEQIENAFSREVIEVTERPIGRRSTPDEQAWPLVFLNSDSASYINGADLPVDGGYWASLSLAGDLWD